MNFQLTIYHLQLKYIILAVFPLQLFSQNSNYDSAVRKYIETYQAVAVKEMITFHVPASITLAQGIFESNAGRSKLAKEANNHFGIKCHKEWTGKTIYQDDETKNECFRKYDCAEESFKDHSAFLAGRDRYKGLFSLDVTDYKGWARGLKAAGYATNPAYADKLIGVIEKYGLYRFDEENYSIAFADSLRRIGDTIRIGIKRPEYEVFAVGPGNRNVYLNNGLQFIILESSDNLHTIARAFGVTEKRLLKWNDLQQKGKLVTGQMVYLEPKKKKGAADSYTVKQGETMYTISQLNGIKLKVLYKKNNIKSGTALYEGQNLRLR